MNQYWIESIWQIIEQQGLQGLTAESLIAKHPNDALEIYQKLSSPHDCLIYLWQEIDEKVLKKHDPLLKGHDELFDMIMNYLEALSNKKLAVRRLIDDLYCSPSVVVSLHMHAVKWAEGILSLCGARQSGLTSLIIRYGFLAFFVYCVEKWLADDTPDMSKTMAAIDGALNQIETFKSYVPNKFW